MNTLEFISEGKFKKQQWVRCMAHIVNLAVQGFLKEMNASVKEFRDYLKATANNSLLNGRNEDDVFLKV